MRKLVTIRTVSEVNPIPGADAIECLTVEGWKVVSQKGNFRPGELCVYFEIDSALPDSNPLWQDLVDKSSKTFEGKKVHVLRTIKLRGQVSQGFCIPLHEFPAILKELGFEINHDEKVAQEFKEAHGLDLKIEVARAINGAIKDAADLTVLREQDWSELLGVVKYEPPIPAELQGLVKGFFPSWIRKTDEERVQNIPEVFDDLNAQYEATIKLDGSSMTVYIRNGEVGVCSRNLELKLEGNENNTLIKVANESGLLKALAEYGDNFAVQGELMGPGIQGNRENLKRHELYVFNIFDIDTGTYLSPDERLSVYASLSRNTTTQLKHVPILSNGFCLHHLKNPTMEGLLEFVEGESVVNDVREGVVFKRLDGKFSFKAISNKFLLRQKS